MHRSTRLLKNIVKIRQGMVDHWAGWLEDPWLDHSKNSLSVSPYQQSKSQSTIRNRSKLNLVIISSWWKEKSDIIYEKIIRKHSPPILSAQWPASQMGLCLSRLHQNTICLSQLLIRQVHELTPTWWWCQTQKLGNHHGQHTKSQIASARINDEGIWRQLPVSR